MRSKALLITSVFVIATSIWLGTQRSPSTNEISTDPATQESPIGLDSEGDTFNLAECVRQGDCRTFEPYAREMLLPEPERPIAPPDHVKRDADNGDPEQATRYGQWLLELNNALAAEPYLETGANGGNLEAHAALAELKLKRSAGNDRIEAWAHLRTIEREDGVVNSELFNRIDALLNDSERTKAEDLAWQYRETMRRARNDLERLKN